MSVPAVPAASASPATLPRPFRKSGWLAILALLAAAFLIGNFKLVTGKYSLVWDAEGFFAPAYTLVADHARAGRILLWNPWDSAGTPDYAEPELGATSPLMVLTGAITGGTESGFRAYFLLIWFLGPVGLLFLARHLGVPPWAALVVALGWMFNGFYCGHASHVSSIYSLSALPWIVWRFDVALRMHRLWAAVQSGGLWGLSALGGYPQLTILTAGFLFLWAVGWWLCSSERHAGSTGPTASPGKIRNLALAASALALCALVGTVILAPPYVAFFREGHGYSDRVGPRSRLEATSSMPMERGALATISSPYLNTVNIYYTRLWPSTDGSYTNVYLGAAIPIFALFAFLFSPRSAWRWWIAGMAMFALTCAVGSQLPVRGWLYDYVSPTRYFRNPGLFRAYGMFCLAVLALFGLKDLASAPPQQAGAVGKKFALAAVVLAAIAVAAYFSILLHVPDRGRGFARATWYLVITWGAALSIAFACLAKPKARTWIPAMLVALALADALMSFSIARAATVSANYRARQVWDELNSAHNPGLDLTGAGFRRELHFDRFPDPYPNNHNLVVKAATFKNYDTMTNHFQSELANDPVLAGMALGNERIWFSEQAVQIAPTDPSYAAFSGRSHALGAPVIVVHSPAQMLDVSQPKLAPLAGASSLTAISQLPSARRLPADLLRYTPDQLDFKITCPAAGWLLVTDRWAPGWSARVNGRPAQVFGGDFIFRALRVSAGQNTIQFSYRPAGYPWLLVLSWTTLALVFANPLRRRRSGHSPSGLEQ